MLQDDKMLKALETVSLGYTLGTVSVDVLMKACENYKNLVSFDDGIDYQILVSKSLFDSLNGVDPDKEVEKAIIPGQTKVIDGVMYIYSATAPGSQTPYAWHVVKKGAKTGKQICRGSKMSSTETDRSQKFINELFPKDLSSLKTINSNIGGSTGAKLVQDVKGAQYILKKNPNNNGHVRSEYLTNQLYDLMGIRVPDYELYDENGDAVLLSKFIPMCKTASMADYGKLAEGFIADTLLANWDVYKNDNCLRDPSGKNYRVDNGGALDYKAQGCKKTFDEDVLSTFNGMVKHNPDVYAKLTVADIKKQIADIKARRNEIVGFLEESGQPVLATIMSKRIANLDKILSQFRTVEEIASGKVVARKLKPAKEMYRQLTEKELKDVWDSQTGGDAYSKLTYKGALGWDLLWARKNSLML